MKMKDTANTIDVITNVVVSMYSKLFVIFNSLVGSNIGSTFLGREMRLVRVFRNAA